MDRAERIVFFVVACSLAVSFVCVAFLFFPQGDAFPRLIFFDVGQGDAILAEIPNDSLQVLIDGGPDETIVEKIAGKLPPGDRVIDVVIVTHPHDDHLAGVIQVMKKYQVGLVVFADAPCETPGCLAFAEELKAANVPRLTAVRGQVIHLGSGCSFTVWHPFYSSGSAYKNINNSSIAGTLECGGRSAFLAGDLEQEGEEEMLAYARDKEELPKFGCSTIKIGHHGSKTATTPALLDAVRPARAVISAGLGNSFGHPNRDTLDLLRNRGIEILRTDEIGDIELPFDS